MATGLLFIYGTLLQSGNEFGIHLRENSIFCAKGKFKGVLYDLGEYPGAVYHPQSEGYVHGGIIRLNHPAKTLKIIDQYEGFGEDGPQPNLFVRKPITIESNGLALTCWVYLYNLPIAGAKQILSGDYLAYKAK